MVLGSYFFILINVFCFFLTLYVYMFLYIGILVHNTRAYTTLQMEWLPWYITDRQRDSDAIRKTEENPCIMNTTQHSTQNSHIAKKTLTAVNALYLFHSPAMPVHKETFNIMYIFTITRRLILRTIYKLYTWLAFQKGKKLTKKC